MNLRDILTQYKLFSMEMIQEIKSDGNVEESLEKRNKIIEVLKTLSYSSEEFMNLATELDIMKAEKEAEVELNKVKNSIKEEMLEIKKQRDAAKGYGANFTGVNFLNKHI